MNNVLCLKGPYRGLPMPCRYWIWLAFNGEETEWNW